jgi:hypothetical protein
MKIKNLIPIVSILAVLVLFFFPNPQENFIWYLGTAILFISIIVFLIIKSKK